MNVFEIFNFIYSFDEEKKIILSETKTNTELDILLVKNENGLNFKLVHPFFKLLYKNDSNFKLYNKSITIDIVNFLVKYDRQNMMSRICEAYMFQTQNFDNRTKKYHSYYSKIKSHFLLSFIEDKQNDLSVEINNIRFVISTCVIDPKIKYSFLCIQSDNKLDFKTFKHYVNNLIVSIGFFSGRFHKEEEFFFQSEVNDFSLNAELFYRSSEMKYSFPEPFTRTPATWNWKFKNGYELNESQIKKYSSTIDISVFSKLLNILIEYPRVYFSIRMMFSFYNFSTISKLPHMFVILEVICEEFKKSIQTDFVKKQLKYESGQMILKKYRKSISTEDFSILEDIVENIDRRLTNNIVNYEQIFKALKINLTEQDRKTIKKRNDFFHGRIIPKNVKLESEEMYVSLEQNYFIDSLRLYVLVSKLILKKVNFSGYLINYPVLFNEGDNSNEPYFIKA